MKPSTVLRRALKLLGSNGEKWWQGEEESGCFCPMTAIWELAPTCAIYDCAERYLRRAVRKDIVIWNDYARSFATIRRGFQRAITLAEKEER